MRVIREIVRLLGRKCYTSVAMKAPLCPDDVAAYIISKSPKGITVMKLQKLLYYSQAWSLVWDEKPLFEEDFQAWAGGPVVPSVYQTYKGEFLVERAKKGNKSKLTSYQKETVDAIVRDYGKYTAIELSDLSHTEKPWVDARHGLAPNERGNSIISQVSMLDYYGHGKETRQ